MSVGLTKKSKLLVGSKPLVRKPHGFQRRGVEWLVSHAGAGLFADPGCGKTAMVLRALLAVKQAKVSRRTLVVAPLRVATKVWPSEAEEWAGSEWATIADLKIVVLHGKYKDVAREEDADIYVINPDGLKWLFEDNYKKFKAMNIDTLVIDESTMFKNRGTKRFKMLRPLLTRFARRWILTGTPTPRSYMDLFGQIYILDLGYALGPYITKFRLEYFTPLDKFGWTWVLKAGSEKRIQKAVAPYIFRLDADDYIKLPKIVENIIRVDLPPSARKLYDEMEEQMLVELEDQHVVIAVSTGTAAMKCGQIANGGLYHMEADTDRFGRRISVHLHDAKTEAVLEIVEELQGSPCLVVYDFKHDLERLKKALGADTPFIGGGVGEKESSVIIDRWNRDELPVLLVHPQTISHGLNLQYGTAHHIIWHSLTYDRELYDQLIRRLRRQGSKQDNVFVHHIIARDTTDEARLTSLRKKGKAQQTFLDALREYAKTRRKYLRKSMKVLTL